MPWRAYRPVRGDFQTWPALGQTGRDGLLAGMHALSRRWECF